MRKTVSVVTLGLMMLCVASCSAFNKQDNRYLQYKSGVPLKLNSDYTTKSKASKEMGVPQIATVAPKAPVSIVPPGSRIG